MQEQVFVQLVQMVSRPVDHQFESHLESVGELLPNLMVLPKRRQLQFLENFCHFLMVSLARVCDQPNPNMEMPFLHHLYEVKYNNYLLIRRMVHPVWIETVKRLANGLTVVLPSVWVP